MIEHGQLLANDILNALASHIAVIDMTGTIVTVNQAWSRFAQDNGGAPGAGAYIGENYLSVCQDAMSRGDETARIPLEGIEHVLRGDQDSFSYEYPCESGGRERWFRMSVTKFMPGTNPYAVIAHEEITTQKEHEHALRHSELLLKSVLDALPVGVWIVDAEGQIVQGNPAGVRIWAGARYVPLEEFGQYKGWWLSTGEPIAAHDWAAARAIRNGETSIDEEIEIECFDKTHKILLNSAIPLRDAEGRVRGAIIVNQDVTRRKHAEAEREALWREHDRLRLIAEDANRKKDNFIAMLSHELRTPLQSVLGWTRILKGKLADPQASGRAAQIIDRNARIAAQLLSDTLDMSRIAHGQLKLETSIVDLRVLIAEVCEIMQPMAQEKLIDFRNQVDCSATVQGDPIRLEQIVWNLLTNAVKFTPEAGRVEVSARLDDGWVEVAVRDTGEGIAPEFIPFLFDRFRQDGGSARNRLGLGLGLAIAKELAGLHHGTISAASQGIGHGATFTLRLPLVTTRPDAGAAPGAVPPTP